MKNSIIMSAVFDASRRRGGVVHFIEVAECLSASGIHVTVVLPCYKPKSFYSDLFSPNIRLVLLPAPTKIKVIGYFIYEIIYCLWLVLFLDARKYDCLYQRTTLLNLACGVIAKFKKVSYILEVNGLIREETKHQRFPLPAILVIDLFHGLNLKLASHVITVTSGIKSILSKRYLVNPKKISVVSNGANPTLFNPSNPDFNILAGLQIDPSRIIIVYVGVFASWHGLSELRHAISCTSNHNISLVLLGDGPMFEEFCLWASQNKMHNVHLLGHVDYDLVSSYISIADYCYIGITKEPLEGGVSPLKFYEYIACGKNLICSDVPDINKIVKEHHLGYLFDGCNQLTDIFDSLAKPSSTSLSNTSKIRDAFLSTYTWSAISQQVARTIYPSVSAQ